MSEINGTQILALLDKAVADAPAIGEEYATDYLAGLIQLEESAWDTELSAA